MKVMKNLLTTYVKVSNTYVGTDNFIYTFVTLIIFIGNSFKDIRYHLEQFCWNYGIRTWVVFGSYSFNVW